MSKTCYTCKNYFSERFCGYELSNCLIYGSLDVDQLQKIFNCNTAPVEQKKLVRLSRRLDEHDRKLRQRPKKKEGDTDGEK